MTPDTYSSSLPVHDAEVLPEQLFSSGIRVTIIGIIINALLIVGKLYAGIAGSSRALIADAIHSGSDFMTDFGVLIGLRFLVKPADSNHPYGHGRLETSLSFIMGLVIILTGLGIMKNASQSIFLAARGIQPKMPGVIALIMGFASIVSKEALYHYTIAVARKTGSSTLAANAWHHRSDAFSSVATVLGVGGALVLGERWTVLDPIAAAFVSILVIIIGVDIGWKAFRELSDEALSSDRERRLKSAITAVKGIKGFHKVRTRSLGRYVTVDVHILVDPEISVRLSHDIATEAENAIRTALGNAAFIMVHIEPYDSAQHDSV